MDNQPVVPNQSPPQSSWSDNKHLLAYGIVLVVIIVGALMLGHSRKTGNNGNSAGNSADQNKVSINVASDDSQTKVVSCRVDRDSGKQFGCDYV
jgi:hypothetical protein